MGQDVSASAYEIGGDMPGVAVIILNWNGWRDTEDCLLSLARIDYRNYDVIVVDNGSTDGSDRELKRIMQDMACASKAQGNLNMPVSFVELSSDEAASEMPPAHRPGRSLVLIGGEENCGFAKGNDIGIEYALKNLSPDYILLLNSDTLVEKDFLLELVKVGEADKAVGSVQSLLLKPGGMVVDSLGIEPKAYGAVDLGSNSTYKEELLPGDVEIFGPCAAAALYRSEALKRVGLLDEAFFVLYEDVDLCWRLRLAGFKSILAHRSIVYHKRGISACNGAIQKTSLLRRYHSNKNWLMLAVRYYPLRHICPQPLRYMILVGWCMLYSAKLGRTREISAMLYSSIMQRMANRRNPLLRTVQRTWINRTRS